MDEAKDTEDMAGPVKKADQRHEDSFAKSRPSDAEVFTVEGFEDSGEDVAREKADPSTIL